MFKKNDITAEADTFSEHQSNWRIAQTFVFVIP